ncbi:peptidase M20 [Clostridia bacterium]|nr:peptidase M20 [Clostridia bacterium]
MVVLSAAGAALLFYSVLFIRAAAAKRPGGALNPALEMDNESVKRAAESLAALIRFRTVAGDFPAATEWTEWVKLRDYLRRRYPNIHSALEREIVGDYSLLFRWKAEKPIGDPILLCGHLDVAPADGLWEHPPFAGTARDGYIWGRGALDCKNVVVCLMETIEGMLGHGYVPRRDVYIALGHDHESGGEHGAGALARVFAERSIRFHMILDEGGAGACLSRGTLPLKTPVAQIAVAEKGRVTIRLTAASRGGHASVPPRHTAVGLLSEAIARAEYRQTRAALIPLVREQLRRVAPALPFLWRFALVNLPVTTRRALKLCEQDDKLNALVRTTFAAVRVSAGTGTSGAAVLPTGAEAYLNARLLGSPESVVGFLKDLVADLGVEAETLSSTGPSAVSDFDTPQFGAVCEVTHKVFGGGLICVPSLLTGDSDARRYEQYCGQIFRFSPFVLTPVDQDRLHAADEGVRTESLGPAIGFYRELLMKFTSTEEEERLQ